MAEKQPTIQNFIASMNKAGGFARTARYAVLITPPSKLLSEDSDNFLHETNRQVNLHCSAVSMPGHDLQAMEQQHGSAPGREIVRSHDYAGTIAATFYLDSHLRERHFFEQWQRSAVNTQTHKANYYDNYIGTMEIYQLDGEGEITYGIKATEVYPTTMAGIEYAYSNSNTIATQVINFQYRQWYNMTSDEISGYSNRLDLTQRGDRGVANALAQSSLERNANSLSGTSLFSSQKAEQKRQEQLRTPEINKASSLSGTSLFSSDKAEQKRQEQLRTPEVDVDRHDVNRKRLERLERLKKPEVDKQLPNTFVQQEAKRQEQLRKPEIDRQDSSRRASIKEAKRQEQLRSTTSN